MCITDRPNSYYGLSCHFVKRLLQLLTHAGGLGQTVCRLHGLLELVHDGFCAYLTNIHGKESLCGV